MIRLLLVDDLAVVRNGMRMRLALENDLLILGEAADGSLALEMSRDLHPDIVLMDAEMPRMDGIAATVAMRATLPQISIILLSLDDDASSRKRAIAAGAAAFVSKRSTDTALIGAIRQVFYSQKLHLAPLGLSENQLVAPLEAEERELTSQVARRFRPPRN